MNKKIITLFFTGLLLILVILLGFCLFGCAKDNGFNEIENTEDQAKTLDSVNLDGISVYSSLNSVLYKGQDEPYELQSNELLVFINGSLAPAGSAFMINDQIYVSFVTVINMLNVDADEESDKYDQITVAVEQSDRDKSEKYTVNDTVFLPLDIVSDLLSCSVYYSDNAKSGENCMIKSCPHIIIERYPKKSARKTEEEATAHLRKQLVAAYEEKYGSFIPLYEQTNGEYDEQNNLRYLISNLSVKSENSRFYIIECVFEFYVDKFTDDIFIHYEGFDESFSIFDPYKSGALSFAG